MMGTRKRAERARRTPDADEAQGVATPARKALPAASVLPASGCSTGGAATALLSARAAPLAPRAPGQTTVRARFGELRGALAEGWEIVQPIFARPLWSTADDSATAFNFVLRRERATRLVTVPEGRTVQRFIRDQHLLVDYRH
ncbi:MAG: hypothetical protein IVW57_10185 [Ktedonobacterales bacterium]|nr:hypothetical protein [Ktedonobacterales bacterium]